MKKNGLIYRGAIRYSSLFHARETNLGEDEGWSVPSLHFSSRLGLAMEYAYPNGYLVGIDPSSFLTCVRDYWDKGLIDYFSIIPTNAFRSPHTIEDKVGFHKDPWKVTEGYMLKKGFEIIIYFNQPCKFTVPDSSLSVKKLKKKVWSWEGPGLSHQKVKSHNMRPSPSIKRFKKLVKKAERAKWEREELKRNQSVYSYIPKPSSLTVSEAKAIASQAGIKDWDGFVESMYQFGIYFYRGRLGRF